MSNTIVSTNTRRRGRGTTAEARKHSRAAFKAWDTRRAMAAQERRRAAAKKAVKTRKQRAA